MSAREVWQTIVIGGGQAGLATGYYLRRAGLQFTILEAGSEPVGSWPRHYDSLKLFSPARYSSLPGLPFPGDPDRYPSRDEVVAYLRQYADHFKLPVITNMRIESVTRAGDIFTLTSTTGDCLRAHTLIAATGGFHQPNLPEFPGQQDFGAKLLHSSAYRAPEPFRGCRVLVVGAGNSAVQIAAELGRIARVTLTSRSSVRWAPQRILGRDIHYWLGLTGATTLPLGRWIDFREPQAVLDTGVYRAAIGRSQPDWRPLFTSFTADGVVWSDGRAEPVDAVIFATGFRANLPFLADLGALDSQGRAVQRAGVSLTTPGLYFVGLPAQRIVVSATLRGVGPDAAFVVRHLRRYLRRIAPR